MPDRWEERAMQYNRLLETLTPDQREQYAAAFGAVERARQYVESGELEHNAQAAVILRALYHLGEQPIGKFYAAPSVSVERVDALINWLRKDLLVKPRQPSSTKENT
jgi:hypothetical protein